MGTPQFSHLHLHTSGSVADAMLRVTELAKRIKELGMSSVAITDHGNMFNVVHFYKACKREGIKPIIGMEAYVAPRSNTMKQHKLDDANYHLVLLSETQEGYQNLINIASDSSVNGFYYKPRTDKKKLREWHNGIIALSACLGGEVQSKLLEGNYELAKETALIYNDIFGQNNFFLELQEHGIPEQKTVNEQLIRMSKETGIPLVCTNDCHYLTKEDYVAHDVLMAIQAKTTVDSDKRKKYGSDQFYVKSPEEMESLFGYVSEALENTAKIAERCNVEIDFKTPKLPPFKIPDNFEGDNFQYMLHLTEIGIKNLYGGFNDEIRERMMYEANIVKNMGYVNYFLIVWDFFRFCRDGTDDILDPPRTDWTPIYTGPGRGSGAGSILTYALGITKIDPLRYNLLFERFLDPSRISMPDIDSDFEFDRRQEVIDYVVRKYGRQSVCQIITYGTMAARAVIRLVGKALDAPAYLYDKAAKMIPAKPGITLQEALKDPDFLQLYNENETVKEIVKIALRLEGLPSYTSTHAAGVLITDPKGVTAHVPIWSNDGTIVSQYDMTILEELNLLKMDFLGLRTLGVIHEAVDMIYKNHGVVVNLDELYECRDMAPTELLAEGKTDGIFQLEGSGLTDFVKEVKPRDMEEWIAVISLYRPGPMQYIPTYVANRRNHSLISYPFPELESILGETYGVLTYQEQCMRTVVAVAGYDKSDSDSFRKVIAKKKKELIPLHRKWFIDGREAIDLDEYGKPKNYGHPIPGGLELGHPKTSLEKFFDDMTEFGKYAFNKSHAAAYAVVSYVTAWLKYYYPVEFMSALMNSVNGAKKKEKISRYINHCRNDLGIDIIPPDINISTSKFVATKDGKIVFTLNALNVSEKIMCSVEEQRELGGPFTSFRDFILRNLDNMTKSDITALASIGAFRSIGCISSQIAAAATDIADRISKAKQARNRANASGKPFDMNSRLNIEDVIPDTLTEYPNRIIWSLEREYLGLYLTGHPLYNFLYHINKVNTFSMAEMDYDVDEDTGLVILRNDLAKHKTIRFVGMFSSITKTVTRSKKEKMAITEIEDLTGVGKMLIFPEAYATYERIISCDKVYEFTGTIKTDPEEPPIIILKTMTPLEVNITKRLVIEEDDKERLLLIIRQLKSNRVWRGDNPVFIVSGGIKLLLTKEYWVNLDTVNLEGINYQIM